MVTFYVQNSESFDDNVMNRGFTKYHVIRINIFQDKLTIQNYWDFSFITDKYDVADPIE